MRACVAVVLLAGLSAAAGAGVRDDATAARVTIVRDGYGIAHVHGRSDADAVFGMAYAQAEDDFPRIERNYLVALGRLSEAEGDAAIWQDLRQRIFVDPDRLKVTFRRSPRWLRALMRSWAGGLNLYLARHGDMRPRVLARFEPWMALAFSEGSIGGDIESNVDLAALRSFYDPDAPGTAPVLASAPFRLVEPSGSNGIAIGPTRAEGGHPLLWINPHTSFFFRAEQQVSSDAGLDVYGAATWGQFFVYQGFNRTLGWMHTSAHVDNVDEFAETVERRSGRLFYRFGPRWCPVAERAIALRVRQGDGSFAERRFTVFATRHGPVIRQENGRWISLALLNAPLAALEQSFLRTKAKSVREYLAVSGRKANSTNNTILAAADGTVAFLPPQFVPRRSDRFDYTRPVDGSDPATGWRGLHRLADLPQVIAPSTGYVFNTNNWPWTTAGSASPRARDFPRYMDQLGENPRGIHAGRLLAAGGRFSAASLARAAFDPALPFFEEQIPLLLRGFRALVVEDPRRVALAEPVAMLAGWDRRWATTSRPTALAVHWGEALWASEGPRARAAHVPLFRWLSTRTTDADRLAALSAAVERMERTFGTWRIEWGRINRFQRINPAIHATFDDRRTSLPVGFTSGNFGSLASFAVERQPGQRCLYGTSGNSFVAVVEFGPRVRAWAVSAGGESGDPRSVHFDDQARRYVDGDLRPIPLTPAELRPFLPGRYHPGEARPADAPPPEPSPVDAGRCGDL